MPLRIIIILIVFLFADIYAFQAFRTVSKDWSPLWTKTINVFYFIPPILTLFVIAIILSGNMDIFSRRVWTYIASFLMITYLSKLVVAFMLLIGDLSMYFANLTRLSNSQPSFMKYDRPKLLGQFAIIIGAIPFATLIYGIIRNAYRYRVMRVSVTLDNLPSKLNGLKIVQISDIHSGSFTMKEPVKKAVELINKENADVVFFTGDIVNERASEMENFIDVFDKIKAKNGVFSILGNHDYGDYGEWKDNDEKVANFESLKNVHKQLGWDLLLNENRVLEIEGEKLGIIGVENYSAHHRFRTAGDLKKAYQGVESAPVKLLLSHDPSHWDHQVNKDFKDIDITFSGHTHGFQFGIEIPGFIKWSPSQYLYKQWGGLYQKGKQYIYVNRGLGFLGYPGRIGILPEITVMELKSGKVNEI